MEDSLRREVEGVEAPKCWKFIQSFEGHPQKNNRKARIYFFGTGMKGFEIT